MKSIRRTTTTLNYAIFCITILLLASQSQVAKASSAAGTETLVGIVGKDFVLVGADSSASQSIALTASNLDKIAPLSEQFYNYDQQSEPTPQLVKKERQKQLQQPCIVAAAAGDAAGSDRLLGMLKAQATLEEYENGLGCDVDYIAASGDSSFSSSSPGLDVDAMANLARIQIAQSLRSRTPFSVCLLIAGMSSRKKNSGFVAQRIQHQVRNAWNAKEETPVVIDDTGEEESFVLVETVETEPKEEEKSPTLSSSSLEPKLYWLDEYGSSQCIQYGAHGHGANFLLSILDQGFAEDMTLDEAMELMKSCFQQLRTRYVINSPQPPCIKCVDANGIRLIR
ncbi:unnamed protein product [Cylindrotheca closterium]|uniref:Proteasome subunit beta n=1 Tax=Cylindrotheca closterium TaxID=2856 RepID=A0AAD2CLP6_9STRA|nr:unnamed protein product [Cylindrotheca closterium]